MPFRGKYPEKSKIRGRFNEFMDDKWGVALHVARERIGNGQKIVLLDGSSTPFVLLAAFECRRELEIFTPSIAVANEFALLPPGEPTSTFSVHLAEGVVDPELCAVFGEDARLFVQTHAKSTHSVIISVKQIHGLQGPTGEEPSSLKLKEAAVDTEGEVIFLADHFKLSQPFAYEARLFMPEAKWEAFARRLNCHVVTTTPPNYVGIRKDRGDIPDVPETPLDWYRKNARKLLDYLGGRFHEVERQKFGAP